MTLASSLPSFPLHPSSLPLWDSRRKLTAQNGHTQAELRRSDRRLFHCAEPARGSFNCADLPYCSFPRGNIGPAGFSKTVFAASWLTSPDSLAAFEGCQIRIRLIWRQRIQPKA
jgi:hypothetical protein